MKQDTFLHDVDASVTADQRVGYDGTDVRRIALQVTNISYDAGVFLQVQQEPGKSNSLAYENRLAYGDNLGSDNPILTVQGLINLDDYDETGTPPVATDNFSGLTWAWSPTVRLLQQIYTTGHIFKLYDKFNKATLDANDTWRIHSLTGVFDGLPSSQTIGPINVMCVGCSIKTDNQTLEGAKITFTLKFKEVRV